MRFFAFYLAAALLFASCAGGHRAVGADSASDSDSVANAADETVAALPDTTYASAEAVKYDVSVAMEGSDGEIDNLRDLYADTGSVLTFRGGLMRNADFGGTVKGRPSQISVDWTFNTDEDFRDSGHGRWGGGSGWTGQPLYVEWPDSAVRRLRAAGAVNDNFDGKELMVGSLCSKVYFINPETGKATREPIAVGNPIKGTISMDPTFNGNLYVGHGVPAERPFGALLVDLYSNKIVDTFGEDPKAGRRWGAYDSSAPRVGQFVFRPGENGGIYKYLALPGEIRLHSVMRYTVDGTAPGIEASMAVYANYGFVADNRGNVIAVNLNTLRPVWRYALGDDTDATPVLEIEDGKPYLYVGCEIDLQAEGEARFAKLDALTGREIWRATSPGKRFDTTEKKHFDGGFYATALPGRGDCEELIFVNCVANTKGQNGEFVAFRRDTGKIAYRTPLKYYSWSSPVGFLNEKGEQFVVTGDCAGRMYLIEGKSGEIIWSGIFGNNFESSPVVRGSSLYVGSRGTSIFRLTVK